MTTITIRKSQKPRNIYRDVYEIIEDPETATKIYVYMSKKSAGDDYDGYEANYVDTALNPVCVRGYMREVQSEALVWKNYGLANIGAKEFICRMQYRNYFENSTKITIEDIEYQVFKEGTGNRSLINERPGGLIRVVLTKKS